MVSNKHIRTWIKRAAFILGGAALAIAASEIVYAIYIHDPFNQWNGVLRLLWFGVMIVSFLLVTYGFILNDKPLFG